MNDGRHGRNADGAAETSSWSAWSGTRGMSQSKPAMGVEGMAGGVVEVSDLLMVGWEGSFVNGSSFHYSINPTSTMAKSKKVSGRMAVDTGTMV